MDEDDNDKDFNPDSYEDDSHSSSSDDTYYRDAYEDEEEEDEQPTTESDEDAGDDEDDDDAGDDDEDEDDDGAGGGSSFPRPDSTLREHHGFAGGTGTGTDNNSGSDKDGGKQGEKFDFYPNGPPQAGVTGPVIAASMSTAAVILIILVCVF